MRLFFALWPSAPARDRLAALANEMQHRHGGQCVTPDMLHLTLAFIGHVPAERVPELIALGASIPLPQCRIELDWLAAPAFPLIWTEPHRPPGALMDHAARLADTVRAAGYAIESRAFRPHVTLVRGAASLPGAGPSREIAWTAQRWSLRVSERDAHGKARYRELAGWQCEAAEPRVE